MVKPSLLIMSVFLLCLGCGKREPESRTHAHISDEDIQSLNLSVEIPPADLAPGRDGADRINVAIRGALPNMRQHRLVEAWVNLAIATIQVRHREGEALPISLTKAGSDPVTLTWAETNRWTVNIRYRQPKNAGDSLP